MAHQDTPRRRCPTEPPAPLRRSPSKKHFIDPALERPHFGDSSPASWRRMARATAVHREFSKSAAWIERAPHQRKRRRQDLLRQRRRALRPARERWQRMSSCALEVGPPSSRKKGGRSGCERSPAGSSNRRGARSIVARCLSTDAHRPDQERPDPLPVILGTRERGSWRPSGSAVRDVAPGDHVALSFRPVAGAQLAERERRGPTARRVYRLSFDACRRMAAARTRTGCTSFLRPVAFRAVAPPRSATPCGSRRMQRWSWPGRSDVGCRPVRGRC